jgi:hypothetical protein
MRILALRASGTLVCALLAPAPVTAQMPPSTPMEPVPASIPPQRDIFVPLWTEPLRDGERPTPSARGARGDALWLGTPLPLRQPIDPVTKPEGTTTKLLEFRPSTALASPGKGRGLVVVIRLQRAPAGTAPLLEVAEENTLLTERAWGHLLRRTPEGTDWQFVLPDPAPPPLPGERNPVSARLNIQQPASRTFTLRLVGDAKR